MKIFFLPALFFLSLLNNVLIAQKEFEGIYLSAKDFVGAKLSYQKEEGKKYKLIIHPLTNSPVLKVIIGDSAFTLKKDSVFGYCDKKNKPHRFYSTIDYLILNPKEKLLIYSSTSLNGYKNAQTSTEYFFSAYANTEIYSLTRRNLKFVFINKNFQALLDVYFPSDETLNEYDAKSKMYLLNKVEKLSQ